MVKSFSRELSWRRLILKQKHKEKREYQCKKCMYKVMKRPGEVKECPNDQCDNLIMDRA